VGGLVVFGLRHSRRSRNRAGCGWNFAFCNFCRLDEMLTPNAKHQTKPAMALGSKTSFLSERKSPAGEPRQCPHAANASP